MTWDTVLTMASIEVWCAVCGKSRHLDSDCEEKANEVRKRLAEIAQQKDKIRVQDAAIRRDIDLFEARR